MIVFLFFCSSTSFARCSYSQDLTGLYSIKYTPGFDSYNYFQVQIYLNDLSYSVVGNDVLFTWTGHSYGTTLFTSTPAYIVSFLDTFSPRIDFYSSSTLSNDPLASNFWNVPVDGVPLYPTPLFSVDIFALHYLCVGCKIYTSFSLILWPVNSMPECLIWYPYSFTFIPPCHFCFNFDDCAMQSISTFLEGVYQLSIFNLFSGIPTSGGSSDSEFSMDAGSLGTLKYSWVSWQSVYSLIKVILLIFASVLSVWIILLKGGVNSDAG